MTVSYAATRIRHTFTRAQLAEALTAVDRPDILDGVYADRPEEGRHGRSALTLDYDDPGDLAVFVVAVARLLPPCDGVDFAAATSRRLPGHPSDQGPSCAQWPCWDLDEPTPGEWSDEMNECQVCRAEDYGRPDCLTHARAPWEPQLAGVTSA